MFNSQSTQLTTKEVADRLGVHVQTVKNWRKQGTGPPFFKIGPRLIRYLKTEVDSWLENTETNQL